MDDEDLGVTFASTVISRVFFFSNQTHSVHGSDGIRDSVCVKIGTARKVRPRGWTGIGIWSRAHHYDKLL